VLGFTTTVNRGAGVWDRQGRGLVPGFSLLALGFIVWMFVTSKADQRVVHLALGLITAGALGNSMRRAVFHGVRTC